MKADFDLETQERVDPVLQSIKCFSKVVDSTFGCQLKLGHLNDIQTFKESYVAAGVSITPKVNHIYKTFNLTQNHY